VPGDLGDQMSPAPYRTVLCKFIYGGSYRGVHDLVSEPNGFAAVPGEGLGVAGAGARDPGSDVAPTSPLDSLINLSLLGPRVSGGVTPEPPLLLRRRFSVEIGTEPFQGLRVPLIHINGALRQRLTHGLVDAGEWGSEPSRVRVPAGPANTQTFREFGFETPMKQSGVGLLVLFELAGIKRVPAARVGVLHFR